MPGSRGEVELGILASSGNQPKNEDCDVLALLSCQVDELGTVDEELKQRITNHVSAPESTI
jgi:hypothetical protein